MHTFFLAREFFFFQNETSDDLITHLIGYLHILALTTRNHYIPRALGRAGVLVEVVSCCSACSGYRYRSSAIARSPVRYHSLVHTLSLARPYAITRSPAAVSRLVEWESLVA